MKERQYVIKRESIECYLSTIYVGKHSHVLPFSWAYTTKQAIHFNKEEAEETIKFIENVMDWELAEELTIIEIE